MTFSIVLMAIGQFHKTVQMGVTLRRLVSPMAVILWLQRINIICHGHVVVHFRVHRVISGTLVEAAPAATQVNSNTHSILGYLGILRFMLRAVVK